MGELSDVERPRLNDDLHGHPLTPPAHAVDPADNLPRPMVGIGLEDTLAPPMTPENFVCMGDESVFVVRDEWGDIILRVPPTQVRRDRAGNYRLLTSTLNAEGSTSHPVEPLRPQCAYYRRVMTSFEGQTQGMQDIRHVSRVCVAQRSETGEFVSLGGSEVFACEHRSPRDFVSEDRLRRFDERVVEQSRKTEETWDPEQAITQSLSPLPQKDP